MLARMMRNTPAAKASRRGFLLGSAAVSGALVIGFRPSAGSAQSATAPAEAALTPYIRIGADNRVTIAAAHMEMGQGIYHGTATLVNEELRADWSQIDVVGGANNPKAFGNLMWGGAIQGTGGSTGLASSYDRYRKAGAAARLMLVQAAASDWKVPAAEITVERGIVRHGSKQATFGALASKAAALPIPANVPLRDPKDWIYIGKDRDVLGKLDSRAKSTGAQVFTIDVKLPGLLTAVMIHPPLFGATVKSFDAAKAKAMPGVVDVVQVPRGIAVVADNMWHALKAREAVTVAWDDSRAEKRSSAELMASYRETAMKPGGANAVTAGNVDAAFKGAAKVLEATFEFPYLAHAALEPLNAVARIGNGRVEVWGGHQMPDIYQAIAAQVAGVTPDRVTMHVMKTGGGFGRRAVADGDIIQEAVSVSRALGGRPVKVQWDRENDMRGGRYRPAYVHYLKAGLDKEGNVVAWYNHIVGQSIMTGTPFEAGYVKNGVDPTSTEGAHKLPYAFPAMKVDLTTAKVGVPVLWWRAVGSTHTAYAVEAFIDELAEAAGKDPIQFRLAMMKDSPRHVGVLRLAAEKAGWGQPLSAGRFRGVALAESFNTFVAQIAEVSLENGQPRVHRVICAIDCGIAVNPDNIRAQVEGGVGFGLGAVLKSQLTLDGGKVVQGNFDGYEVLRIDEMPQVEVHIVPSAQAPTGVGEPGVPPIGPAVANAFYQASKRRVRILPFNRPENA
ncbi:MAG: xanthine dehydrogenase family protein molybdopterin-binding subunit [Methylocystis sp.]|nr:xanthine dehydrogenase family protein molybdopterin-binding subunit [Methylocystis sp.]MCA3582657.1 xanthine dehydrogenase family protein molybdopterin-binding subunit [Methylocystis sp.]MCA3588660.1 xanthine dehydrogenase family protein molybdopterin-binding subunit [Methylocystis sp.]MCA3591670.1 xanthine dehydrogenase family protein molybdopterin-binding subunit [Methylocystis sp.]